MRIQDSKRYKAPRSKGTLAVLKAYANDNHVSDHMLKALRTKQSRCVMHKPALEEYQFTKKCGSSGSRKTNPEQVVQCHKEWTEYSSRVVRQYVNGILACFSDGACVDSTTGAGWYVTDSIYADNKLCDWERRHHVAIGNNSEICQAELVGAYETLKTILELLRKHPELRRRDRAILHIDNELVFRIMVGELWSDAHGVLANQAYQLITEIRKLDIVLLGFHQIKSGETELHTVQLLEFVVLKIFFPCVPSPLVSAREICEHRVSLVENLKMRERGYNFS